MDINEIKDTLKQIKENPEILKEEEDDIDKMLREVIKIERRHIFGSEATSEPKRREELLKFLTTEFAKL